MSDDNGFRQYVGLDAEPVRDGIARVVLTAEDHHLNAGGAVHGGALATMLDAAMGTAVSSTTEDGSRPVTVAMTVTYLEQAKPGRLVATARVRKQGKRLTIVEGEVEQDGTVVADAIATFATMKS
ncbi:MAG: PaaI family thioesterase [Actinomycetota bacterium]|nr:PaaI family thioesterase [Actinomycetota bacterium]